MKVVQTTVPATANGSYVPGLLMQPESAVALLLFGHGAGTPMRAPLMNQLSEAPRQPPQSPHHPRLPSFRGPHPESSSNQHPELIAQPDHPTIPSAQTNRDEPALAAFSYSGNNRPASLTPRLRRPALIRRRKHHLREPPLERLVIAELA